MGALGEVKMSENNRYPSRYLSSRSFWSLLALLVLGVLLTWQFWAGGASPLDPRAAPRPITPRGDLAADEKSTIALFRQASPSVVHITTLTVALLRDGKREQVKVTLEALK